MHKCQICNKRPAAMKIVKVTEGQLEDYHVCEECASGLSTYAAKIMKKAQLDLKSTASLLSDLMKGQEEGASVPGGKSLHPAPPDLQCPSCGLDFTRYRQTYMLGCPACYDAFGEALESDIRKIHGATEHTGGRTQSQERLVDFRARLKSLKHELDEAVREEDFDKAAKLRDKIRTVQEEAESVGGEARK